MTPENEVTPGLIHGTTRLMSRRLGLARDRLAKLGFRVSPHGRVAQAIKVMEEFSGVDFTKLDAGSTVRLADAMSLTFDLVHVVDSLSDAPPPGLVESLRRSLDGVLGDLGPSEHRRALSELHFGVALVAAGIPVGSPRTRPTKTTDYIATVGPFDYLIEVKRPSSEEAIRRKVDEAITQFREFVDRPACLVIDLSDFLPYPICLAGRASELAANSWAFDANAGVAKHIVEAKRRSGECDIALLATFAVCVDWSIRQEGRLPVSGLYEKMQVFSEARAGIVHRASQELMGGVKRGLELLTGKLNVLTREEQANPWRCGPSASDVPVDCSAPSSFTPSATGSQPWPAGDPSRPEGHSG